MTQTGGDWSIVLYQTGSGRKPVQEFIRSLEPATKSKTARLIDLLETYGPALGMPHSKRLTAEIRELRVRGVIDVRIFYAFVGQTVYLLHGFSKKSQQIPQRELATASTRFREIIG